MHCGFILLLGFHSNASPLACLSSAPPIIINQNSSSFLNQPDSFKTAHSYSVHLVYKYYGVKAQNSSSLNIITFPIYIAKLSTHTVQTIKDINCVKQSSYKLYHITCLEVEPVVQISSKFYSFYAVYSQV